MRDRFWGGPLLAPVLACCAVVALAFAGGAAITAEGEAEIARPFPSAVAKELLNASSQEVMDAVRGKIVGGRPAQAGQFKWQVALILAEAPGSDPFRGFFCGGSLVGWRWVLTAAHCVHQQGASQDEVVLIEPDSLHVYLGSHNFDGGERIRVKRIISHQEYDANNQDGDLALLELLEEPKHKQRVALITLAAAAVTPSSRVGERATVLGWGSTAAGTLPAEARRASQSLRYVEVQIKDSGLCGNYHLDNFRSQLRDSLVRRGRSEADVERSVETRYPLASKVITNNMICAGTASGARDACFGDSGGPLVVAESERWVQAGIVSWGPPGACGMTNLFGVYVDVSKYLGWISKHIQ
jgi:secreted trypsin-like serine protease